jgi:5'-phosphate synthase pdxT subunit
MGRGVGPGATVLAEVDSPSAATSGEPSAKRKLLATSFHPEITDDSRIHRYFLEEIVGKVPLNSGNY